MIPQHQCRTVGLQQQRYGGPVLSRPSTDRSGIANAPANGVMNFTAGEVEAVRPTGRRHTARSAGTFKKEEANGRIGKAAVVTTQITNLIQRTRDNLRVLELGKGTLRSYRVV